MILRRLGQAWFLSLLLACWIVQLPALDARAHLLTIVVPVEAPKEWVVPCAGSCTVSADARADCPKGNVPPLRCCICFSVNDLNVLAEPVGVALPPLPCVESVAFRETFRSDPDYPPPVPPPKEPFLSRPAAGATVA